MARRLYIWLYSGYSINVYNYTHRMTSLTDKMEGLRANYADHICRFNDAPQTCECYGLAIDKCIALVKTEAAVVGDWEAEFDKRFEIHLGSEPATGMTTITFYEAEIKAYITTLLAAKDKEIAEAYKKGFIDKGLPDRPLNSERE